MWAQIANDLKEIINAKKTPAQVENRYKTIIKRKKKAIENNHKSGSSRQCIEYEQELLKIAAADDSVEPEVLRSSSQFVLKKRSEDDKEKKQRKL